MRKKVLAGFLRVCVSGAIIYYIFSRPETSFRTVLATIKSIEIKCILAAFIGFKIIILISSYRWQILLRAHGIMVSFPRVLGLNLLGLFFNNFMLSLTGGDIIKAYYASKLTSMKKTEAVTTVFIDRFVGLAGLACMGALGVLFGIGDANVGSAAVIVTLVIFLFAVMGILAFNARVAKFALRVVSEPAFLLLLIFGILFFIINRLKPYGTRFILASLVVLLAASFYVFRRKLNDRFASSFQNLKTGMKETLTKAYWAVHSYRGHKNALFGAFGFSMVIWVFIILINYILGLGLGSEVRKGYYFIFVPVINLISAVPITISGWGLREHMYQRFFLPVGMGSEVAVSLSVVFALVMALWSLVGGGLYALRLPRLEKKTEEKDDR